LIVIPPELKKEPPGSSNIFPIPVIVSFSDPVAKIRLLQAAGCQILPVTPVHCLNSCIVRPGRFTFLRLHIRQFVHLSLADDQDGPV
ncbi:hypothetical protein NE664_14870, partial [Anaerotignum faecicola]|nr:hypothetical protein [Anaerotignum faecicola]